MTLVAGIDSSTQSCKVVVCDLESGRVVRAGRAKHPPGTEVAPAAWWDALQAAILDAGGIDDVSALSVGAQQHGMVALNEAGEVVRDALLWNDTRSAQAAEDLIAEFGADGFAERTGCVPVASFTATKLRWMRDNEPSLAGQVAAVALPHDWLTWRLLGYGPDGPCGADLETLVTDRSDASGTAYWRPHDGTYDVELFVAALGHDARRPRVLEPGESAGLTTAQPGIPPWIMVGPGAGDNAGAALGLGASPGDVVVSIGTSGTVFAVTEAPVRDVSGTVAGFADAAGGFLPLVATLNAARVLDAASNLLGCDHDELGRLALAAPPGAGGLVLQPYLEGERTPNLPDATGTLFGLTLASSTRENFARAAIEGLLSGLADGLAAVRRQGVRAERVLLIGGAARNPAVSSIAAQVFGLPVVVPEPGEYVAMGAAVQAAWVLTGSRPTWPIETYATHPADPRPIIGEQYAAVAPHA